jgi:hypothetical protein
MRYRWNSDERNDNVIVSQDGMSNNRIHESYQTPPPSFQKVCFRRKIMAIYCVNEIQRDIPARRFGGIKGI